jgi:acyl-CoA synthetase (AMP-forming)/AMP-acid ligase II
MPNCWDVRMSRRWMIALATMWQALTAVVRSGLLRPVSPATAVRMVGAVRRFGPTPAALLAVAAARHPNRIAIIDDDGPITYRELQLRCEAISSALYELNGQLPPTTIGILCRNHRGFAEALITSAQLGSECVIMNTEFPAAQLQHVLDRHAPEVLVSDAAYLPTLESLKFAGRIVLSDRHTADPGPNDAEGGLTLDGLAARPGVRPPRVTTGAKLTLLTSGTTGTAKGVPQTPRMSSLIWSGVSALAVLRPKANDTFLVTSPLFHGVGLMVLVAGIGLNGTVICPRTFDEARLLDAIDQHQVTVLGGIPVMFQRLVAVAGSSPRRTSLRLALTGGAPLSAHVITEFSRVFGDILVNSYGSSEMGPVSIAGPKDLARHPDSVGRLALGTRVRILRPDRTEANDGKPGTIFVRGTIEFSGYSADESGTPTKEVVDGFINSGDLGHLDRDGRLYIDGREDDMIVSGGENIFPREVEEVLLGHEAIIDTAVRGIPDEEYGQVLRAHVVTAPEMAQPSVQQLQDYLRTRLEPYKVPKEFAFLTEIPRNANGKVVLPRA